MKLIVEQGKKESTELIESYVANVVHSIHIVEQLTNHDMNMKNDEQIANDIYSIITSKEFNYQSKKKIEHNKKYIVSCLLKSVSKNKIITFYYDLGGGYHAKITEDRLLDTEKYSVGFGELLVLYQISKLYKKISRIYSPSIKFIIVIDNYVAYRVNKMPLELTEKYCESFKQLIKSFNMESIIDIYMESSKSFIREKLDEYKTTEVVPITQEEYQNIRRFVDYEISYEEACGKQADYKYICKCSDELISADIGNCVRFLQYSNSGEITFRPYPGGASRIQCGLVGCYVRDECVQPKLYTSKNYDDEFDIYKLEFNKKMSQVKMVILKKSE